MGPGVGLLPDFWNLVRPGPREPQRPEALPAHSPQQRGTRGQDACWAEAQSGHPAHQLKCATCPMTESSRGPTGSRAPGSLLAFAPTRTVPRPDVSQTLVCQLGSRGAALQAPASLSLWAVWPCPWPGLHAWKEVSAWWQPGVVLPGNGREEEARAEGWPPFLERQGEGLRLSGPMCPAYLAQSQSFCPGWDTSWRC